MGFKAKLHSTLPDVRTGKHMFAWEPGFYVSPITTPTKTTLQLVNDRLYLIPIYIPSAGTLNVFRTQITIASSVGATFRAGLYRGVQSNGVNLDGAPLWEVTDPSDFVGNWEWSGIGLPIPRESIYWAALVQQGVPAVPATVQANAGHNLLLHATSSFEDTFASVVAAGALPTSPLITSRFLSPAPFIGLRINN